LTVPPLRVNLLVRSREEMSKKKKKKAGGCVDSPR
jgi:hypothetical protein